MYNVVLSCGMFVLLAAASTVSPTYTNYADVTCGTDGEGIRRRRQGKIVGGVNATEGEFPWIVSLTKSGGHFCGGTLVNSRWVLTAAHCLCSGTDTLGTAGLRVSLGRHDLRLPADLDIPVSKVILHPQFRCASYDSDIALLALTRAVPWSSSVRPACFPPTITPGDLNLADVTVAGWGWTDESSSRGVRSNVLQKVGLSVVDNPQCRDWYESKGKKLKIRDSQLCAGLEKGGKDACWADSGGPLMTQGVDVTVVGVVSTGVGCARPRLPGLYTRVSFFSDWIASTVFVRA